MDSVCLRRVLEGEGGAWGSCAGAHRGVLSFGHFFGREGLLDESLWSRDPHLLEKRGDRLHIHDLGSPGLTWARCFETMLPSTEPHAGSGSQKVQETDVFFSK